MKIMELNTAIRNHRGPVRVQLELNGTTFYVNLTKAEAQNLFASYSVLNHSDEIPMEITESPDGVYQIHAE